MTQIIKIQVTDLDQAYEANALLPAEELDGDDGPETLFQIAQALRKSHNRMVASDVDAGAGAGASQIFEARCSEQRE
jgi:hypothetical protein